MIRRMAVLLGIFYATAQLVGAPTKGTISVSPAVVMLKGAPGQSTTQVLTVTNATTQPFTFEMVAKDVLVTGGKRRFAPAGSVKGSLSATAVFSEKLVRVAPGESHQVSITVTVPSSPAGRAVVAMFQGTNKMQQGGLNVTGSVGTLLTFTLTDNIAMQTGPLTVQPPTSSVNLAVKQQCTNSGAEPIVAKGMLAIISASGAIVGKTALPGRRLLPGETTEMHAEYGGDLTPGRYRALLTYDVESRVVSSSVEFVAR